VGLYVTVLETIQRGTEFLSRKGVDSARLHTELLLAHLLKLPRMRLYLNFERVLTPAEVDGIRELLKRRSQREPLQHIVGSTSFCGLEIVVRRQVLVPRPETELLAEAGWQFLTQLAGAGAEPPNQDGAGANALDYGTGSGCLAIALAANCPSARVEALDTSAEALGIAQQNAYLHGLTARIGFWLGDGFKALPPHLRFDLILSNPPYIPSGEIAGLEPEVRDFDPRAALDGGPDGLDHYRNLAAEGGSWLRARGKLMVELGDGQAESVRQLFQDQNWVVERIVEDYTHRPRIMIAHNRSELPAQGVVTGQGFCPS
jgi:release factor glutamine methyltransferase